MPHRRPRFGLVLATALVLLLAGACGGPPTLQRGSTSAPPTVDGALSEWGGSLSYVHDEPVSMSVRPTDSLLYVALATQDQRLIRSVAKNGLIVWVDPSGGKARRYGVQFPLGFRAQQAGRRGSPSADSDRTGPPGPSRRSSTFDQLALEELDVIRHDSVRVRIPAQFSSGVRAQATIDPGTFVYELAIPTAAGTASAQHGLRAALGPTVGIGLQILEADDASDVSMPTGGVPSVAGRQGRTRRGRQGRRRQRARQSQPPSLPTLDLWMKVETGES